MTPIHCAAAYGHAAVISTVLCGRCDPKDDFRNLPLVPTLGHEEADEILMASTATIDLNSLRSIR